MADFEDSNTPTWENTIEGQINLRDAVAGTIRFTSPSGKEYALGEKLATLLVRPRGWHLVEKHVLVDGEPVSAGLFDFGLYFFHNAQTLLEQGLGPVLLPAEDGEPPRGAALERHLRHGAGRDRHPAGHRSSATVLIETILAAFEMDEILYELREHSAGLNCGRWDYIFSVIKKFTSRPGLRAARPRPGHDDHPLHALLQPAGDQDLPPARRARDRRHGGADPDQERPRGQRRGAREGARPTRSARPTTATTAPGSPTRAWSRSRATPSTRS